MALARLAQAVTATRAGARAAWRALPTKARVGAIFIGVFAFVAIAGPYLAPYDYTATIATATGATAPSTAHLLGTTSTGQDVLSQLLVGTRSTVFIGLLAGVIATFLSVVVGVSAGFLGGFADEGLSLLSNVFLVLPALPLLIVIFGYLPTAGNVVIAFILSLLGWPWGARVIRAQTLSLRSRDFVAASRETGEHTWRLIFFEILPNEVSLIAASFVGTVLYAVLSSVGLAFLGFGVGGSSWSLGTMLYWVQNQDAIQVGAWWWYAPPGICVALFGMGLVLMNFGLDELGSPRLRAAASKKRIGGRAWRLPEPTRVLRESRRPRHLAGIRPHGGGAA